MVFSNETTVRRLWCSPVFRCALYCGDAGLSKWCCTIACCYRLCCGKTLPGYRARAAMPFGCLTLGEKKDYNNPSEVADKYDLGQIVKSWVHPCRSVDQRIKTFKNMCSKKKSRMSCLFNREEFCEIFRAKDRNTLKMYTCKKFHKKDGRKVRKAAKNEIMILKM